MVRRQVWRRRQRSLWLSWSFPQSVCNNGRTIRRDDIERRVLAGLSDKLVSPEAVAVAVRAYAEETNRQNHERRAQAETSRRALEKIERSIKGIMDAIKDGMYQPAMKARMTDDRVRRRGVSSE